MRCIYFIVLIIACCWLSSCGVPLAKVYPGNPNFSNLPTATSGAKVIALKATSVNQAPTNLQSAPPATLSENYDLPIATSVYTGELHIEQASLQEPPEFPADLLYLLDGKLMRWDHISAFPVSFTDHFVDGNTTGKTRGFGSRAQIIEYATDASQRWIAILISNGITANGVDLYDIVLLDLDTAEQLMISDNTRRGMQINLSPDGKWLTYLTQGDELHYQLMPIPYGGETLDLGICLPNASGDCQQAIWSPDSKKLIWSDQSGIWLYQTGSDRAKNILGNNLKVKDASGEVKALPVEYDHLVWSPKGRYATVMIKSRAIDRAWMGLLDCRLGRVFEIPNTYGAGDPSGTVVWLDDGRLLSAIGERETGKSTHLEIWKVLPAHEDLLVQDEIISLSSVSGEDPISVLPAAGIMSIEKVTSIDSRTICFVVRFTSADRAPTLYCLDLKYKLLQRIGEVPHDLLGLAFSPDKNSIIMTGSHGSTLYATEGKEAFLDINPLLGDHPLSIIWLNRTVAGKLNQ